MNKFTKTIAGIVAVLAFVAVASTAGASTFTRSLTVGSTGTDVTVLQTWLNKAGYLAVAPTGYFGNLTKAAVAAFQAANGVTPAVGYFGPLTQAKWEVVAGGSMTGNFPAGCTSAAGYSSTTGVACNTGASAGLPAGCSTTAGFSPLTGASCSGSTGSTGSSTLAGTDGSIDDVNTLSQYNNEEVGEGESDVKVAGFEVKASNDGDIALRSLKLTFDATGNSGSTHIKDYVDSVTVWQGTTKVGSADIADFSKDSSNSSLYSKTITLSNSVVRADKTEKFYVTVDAVSNLDSSDISGDSWTVQVNNIRFEDGSGVVTTDSETGDLGNTGSTIGTNGTSGDGVPLNFVTFSTSANTELKISTDSTTPEAGIVIIDDTDTTDDVVLLKGKIKVDGTSDVLVDQFPVTFTPGSGNYVSDATGSVKLTIDGQEYTETVASSTSTGAASITFDNLDLTLTAGKTYSFTVSADINDLEGTTLVAGDTLKASVTSSNRDLIDAENEEGDQLSDSSEKSGTATGEDQEFRTSGIQLALVSTGTSVAAGTSTNDDQGTFTIRFKVKAVGDDVYVSSLADATTGANTTGKTSVTVDRAGTATTGGVSTVISNDTDTTLTSAGNYLIEDGSEETFTVTTTVQLPAAGAAGLYRTSLSGVRWSTSDVVPVASSYTSNLDSFKTSYIGLN
ncbi:MAG: peptidoglycan-binding domain-containing protein [Patescibacteria group bacterium]